MLYQFPYIAESVSTLDFAEIKNNDLRQYCKSENVMFSSLVPTTEPRNAMKFELELVVCHLLQHVDNWLRNIINQLKADLEHSGKVHRQTL